MFYFVIALIWSIIAFLTNAFVNAILFVAVVIGAYILYRKRKDELSKTLLLPAKLILTFSFWGCVGLCLYSYQKSISCISCMQGYLSRSLNATFDNTLFPVLDLYKRYEIMFILACLWAIIFIFTLKKETKKC